MLSNAAPAVTHGAYSYHGGSRFSVTGIVWIVLAHVAVLALLVSLDVLPLPPPLTTLVVEVMAPPLVPEKTPPTPPRPMPVERKPFVRPTPAPQMLAAQTEAPSAASEAAVAKEAPPPPPTAQPSAAPFTQARFDADYLLNPAPTYPPMSRRLGEEGKVVLRVFVESTGRPSQIEVKTSSGSVRLDQAAQDAVWRWKFVPARRGDETVGAWVMVPIVFNLRG
jgi:protein TonB